MARLGWVWIGMMACTSATPSGDTGDTGVTFEDPPPADAWGPTTGPGASAVTFAEDDLFSACAYLAGDLDRSVDHHNLVVMHDGHAYMPWAPEDGAERVDWAACGFDTMPSVDDGADLSGCEGRFGGGLSVFDVSDPCAPVKVGEGWTPWMRESHSVAFSEVDGRTYAAVDFMDVDGSGGVGFWDVTDPTAPTWVSQLKLPGHGYPNAYFFVTLSVFWQGDLLYASSALNGVHIVDASDPLAPTLVGQVDFGGGIQVGTFHVWGNTAMASSAGLDRTILVDLADPLDPRILPGGDFGTADDRGNLATYYFANVGSRYGLFARGEAGGGPIVYDISDPTKPTWLSWAPQPDGDGGYVFQQGPWLFQGESNFGAVYDFSDPTAPAEVGRFQLKGDLDTVTPMGNVAFVSVDEGADLGQATAVVPWTAAPDTRPPEAGMRSPRAGERGVARTGRIGVVFDEMIEPRSAFAGSFAVWDGGGSLVPGRFHVQENIVNFTPDDPLDPDATYTVALRAGGLTDLSGNPLADEEIWTFSTAGP